MLRHDFVQETLWSSFLPLSKYFLEAISNLSFLLQILEVKIFFFWWMFSSMSPSDLSKDEWDIFRFPGHFFQSPIA